MKFRWASKYKGHVTGEREEIKSQGFIDYAKYLSEKLEK